MKSIKNIVLVAFTGLCLVAGVAHAGTNNPITLQATKATGQVLKSGVQHATDMVLVNERQDSIKVTIPNSNITNEVLKPGYAMELTSDQTIDQLPVLVTTMNGQTLFQGYLHNGEVKEIK